MRNSKRLCLGWFIFMSFVVVAIELHSWQRERSYAENLRLLEAKEAALTEEIEDLEKRFALEKSNR